MVKDKEEFVEGVEGRICKLANDGSMMSFGIS